MRAVLKYLLLITCLAVLPVCLFAQTGELDSIRRKQQMSNDSVVTTAKFIRYTTLSLLKDSIQTLPLDTSLNNFHNYNLLFQPKRPTINLGSHGLANRDMLFNMPKTIGFQAGFHALDIYLLSPDSVRFYRARSPYTELYYVNGSQREQLFRVVHSQNINSRWNIGANFNRIGGEGLYANQKVDHLSAAAFTWYQSKNGRYNILGAGVFNTLKAGENGSTTNDSVFTAERSIRKDAEVVRFGPRQSSNTPASFARQTWRNNYATFTQSYFIGRIDSTGADSSSRILPTQRLTHRFMYHSERYKFYKNMVDTVGGGALPLSVPDTIALTNDSTRVRTISNELTYSFYLRGKSLSFIKNELKLDLGLRHEYINYRQNSTPYPGGPVNQPDQLSFQNVTLKAGLSYRFSNRVSIEGDLNQMVQGRNAGDFLYEAKTNFLLSNTVGRIVLGAYIQNKSPERIFEKVNYQYHAWNLNFDRTKVTNLNFAYQNTKLRLQATAEYFLMNNYLYFQETTPTRQIIPTQVSDAINVLKITAFKHFTFGKFNLESYLVYQKTSNENILRTPDLYTQHSFYFNNIFFKVLNTDIGFDLRYNTRYTAPAYAINVGQFYTDHAAVQFDSWPVVDVWIRAMLKRANLFFKYDYANQGLLSRGYYTVNRYPMQDALMKFGVSWKFYN